jgi:2'-deoxynucleoside 5'-phosphate N-hydrolase
MNIYFAGSIRGGRSDATRYHDIIRYLCSWGTVLTEHVGDTGLTEKGDDGPNDRFIYDRDMAWMDQCDVVIAEVTQPSLGVGYELGMANALRKPILALYRPSEGIYLSAMIGGCPAITTGKYQTCDQAKHVIQKFLTSLSAGRASYGG